MKIEDLKFRVLVTEELLIDYWRSFGIEHCVQKGGWLYSSDIPLSLFWAHIEGKYADPSTLGMWIGLKDKNGKDVYTGDVFGGDWSETCIMFCGSCKSNQIHIFVDGEVSDCLACCGDVPFGDFVEVSDIEIISNIHDEVKK